MGKLELTNTWAPFFKSDARVAGRAAQLEGAVQQVESNNGQILAAEVTDQDLIHTVRFEYDGKAASATCTCDDFGSGKYCKHIWATLLDIQNSGIKTGDKNVIEDAFSKPRLPRAGKRDPKRATPKSKSPDWLDRLTLIRQPMVATPTTNPIQQTYAQVSYRINATRSANRGSLVVETRQRQPTNTGWSKPKPLRLNAQTIQDLHDPVDRQLCSTILGATRVEEEDYANRIPRERPTSIFQIPVAAQHHLLHSLIATDRCFVCSDDDINLSTDTDDDQSPLIWNDETTWQLWAVGRLSDIELSLTLELRHEDQQIPIAQPTLILGGHTGLVIHQNTVYRLDDQSAIAWINHFREDSPRRDNPHPICIPIKDIPRFLDRLYLLPHLPYLQLPEEIARPEKQLSPKPYLELTSPPRQSKNAPAASAALLAEVQFNYDGHQISPSTPGRYIANIPTTDPNSDHDHDGALTPPHDLRPPDTETVLLRRNHEEEQHAVKSLIELGFRPDPALDDDTLRLPAKKMPAAVNALMKNGWTIQADQNIVHRAAPPKLSISSGMDWFELRGDIKFQTEAGEQSVSLPEILKAARSGKNLIKLDDGSQGMLPTEWLEQHGLLTAIAGIEDDHLRFQSAQAVLLDALLDEQELTYTDDKFKEARERIRQFNGINSAQPSQRFDGELRPYQQHGLGWLEFLKWFGMGGILADDMGLGKTIQVLAVLDKHYKDLAEKTDGEKTHHPTLVVAPKSVVFNWLDEASHFTPDLKTLSYGGADRASLRKQIAKHDLVVTSYGMLRRDIKELREQPFHYVVLDEAQAIKNPTSQAAKSSRLLKAQHRLALTGTPVENHLGDIWSIFEFSNPGMLGASAKFNDLFKSKAKNRLNVDLARQIGSALRPFILRRTKKQVLTELPDKTEQTIVCEMEPAQRKIYDELRHHYRQSLLADSKSTIGHKAMVVLEALLRLRQAACHPALIDPKRTDVPSAKLDTLTEQLEELIEEGHKALVFSQFTSMLSLVKQRLDEKNITYEYLDGQTRNRKTPVENFQNNPDVPVFLISLKAGGLGLNLTAAEYVFILDPWWNPAVEAQAIDRTHRIGQTSHVFAYRLICQDTVEQRIIELQQQKRQLADAIVGEQENPLRNLTKDELAHLLS